MIAGGLLLLSLGRGDRDRVSVMGEVRVGMLADEVDDLVGVEPASCATGSLDHLRGSFPEGWSPAAVDVALEQLQAQTVERRVYPVGEGAAGCDAAGARTEVGVGPDLRVLWSVAVVGRTAIRMPPNFTPAGIDSLVAGQSS